jgi:monoterpene epsilon-lactone hydrolase
VEASPGALEVPARTIPVPTSVSPEAQAILAMRPMPSIPTPPLDDAAAWRNLVAVVDAGLAASLSPLAERSTAAVSEISVDGVRVFELVPEGVDPSDRRVILDMHGGALVMGGGDACRTMAQAAVDALGRRMWTVDYRMPPNHPYPAGLDDCLAVYRRLLEEVEPNHIVVRGASAGGSLAAGLVLRARDEGLPMPAGAVLLSPEVDLTESGDSFQVMLGIDTTLTASLMPQNLLYADGHDLADPYLSPLFGDFEAGFCPTLITSGTRDLFLSNAVRMHRALRRGDVPAELHIVEAAPHGAFAGTTPEDRELDYEICRFLDELFGQ